MLQSENIDLEFDIPTDMELAQLAITMMGHEDLDDDEDGEPLFG